MKIGPPKEYSPTDPDVIRHAFEVYSREWHRLSVGLQDKLIRDVQSLIEVEKWNTADAAIHTLLHRVRPASLASYARTLR